ncbi:MAG: glycoside hydrolase family 2 TIM barrel-domain containing protein [Candidatus Omnitrophota bacterium]
MTKQKSKVFKTFYLVIFFAACGLWALDSFAQNETKQAVPVVEASVPPGNVEQAAAPQIAAQPAQEPSLSDLVSLARKAKDKDEFDKVYSLVRQAMERFGEGARAQQKALKDFPPSEQINNYAALNNTAECQFIKAEALKKQGKKADAIAAFKVIVSDFSYAQAWDPRGWYYKLATTSQEAVDRMEGRDVEAQKCGAIRDTKVVLNDPGKEEIINYDNYGDFEGIGTKDYKYVVKFQEGLSEAVGEGIYPNTSGVRWNPAFQAVKKERRLEGSHWAFVHSPDLEAAFFKWALAPEPPGIKLFYTALILERAGLFKHAIKAYYAIVVHYPQTVGWTYWHTPWYVGPASIARIKYLCKKYPQVNMKLVGSKIEVRQGFDSDISNDIFIVDPGRLIKNHIPETFSDKFKKYVEKRKVQSKVIRKLGEGKVRFVQYANNHWQLLVDNRPYTIRGITYAVAKIGQSPDEGTLKGWMDYDYNNNGKSDGPYDAFVDTNKNNKQDSDEPGVGDYQLMKRMGVNTIRLYHQPYSVKKELLRDLFARFGIRVIMGDFLGKYALGSGADWDPGTDYENPQHRARMLESVKQMVLEHKDEPYLLMWLLGNENVYGVACNADKKPEAYFKFVNEAARLIKSLDRDHPVAVASGDLVFFDKFARYAPDVDMYGANVYRGDSGFGSYWEVVRGLTDKPAFITEYGCPAYVYCKSLDEAEGMQAEYLKSCWDDIAQNSAFGSGAGNAIGGVLFEWLDEWWKGYEPAIHDTKGLWVGPFPDGFMHEEWLGVAGQGDGISSPFLRQLRKSYYAYQKLWER